MALFSFKHKKEALWINKSDSSLVKVSEKFFSSKRNLIIATSAGILFSLRSSQLSSNVMGVFGLNIGINTFIASFAIFLTIIYNYIIFEHEMNKTVIQNTKATSSNGVDYDEFDNTRTRFASSIQGLVNKIESIGILRSNDTLREDISEIIPQMEHMFRQYKKDMEDYESKLQYESAMNNSSGYLTAANEAQQSARWAFDKLITSSAVEVEKLNRSISELQIE